MRHVPDCFRRAWGALRQRGKSFTSLAIIFILLSAQKSGSQAIYPLQKDNLWQYWFDTTQAWTTSVLNDSIILEANRYSKIYTTRLGGDTSYWRQFGPQVLIYLPSKDTENVRYDFSKTTGDTIFVFYDSLARDTIIRTIAYDRMKNVFGTVRRQWGYYTTSKNFPYNYVLEEITDGIGLTFDQAEPGDQYFLKGAIINGTRYGVITKVSPSKESAPNGYFLLQNFPNPFNPATTISFNLPEALKVKLTIWDILGEKMRDLFEGALDGGYHVIIWDGKANDRLEVPTGVYIYRLETDDFVQVKKSLLLR